MVCLLGDRPAGGGGGGDDDGGGDEDEDEDDDGAEPAAAPIPRLLPPSPKYLAGSRGTVLPDVVVAVVVVVSFNGADGVP